MEKVVPEIFAEVLEKLQYARCGPNVWQRHEFHLFTHEKENRTALSLHADIAKGSAPFHKSRQQGKDLETELDKIVEAYRNRRFAKK